MHEHETSSNFDDESSEYENKYTGSGTTDNLFLHKFVKIFARYTYKKRVNSGQCDPGILAISCLSAENFGDTINCYN